MIDLLNMLSNIFGSWFWMIAIVVALFVFEKMILACLRLIGLYVVVNESRAHVYVLFGNVIGQIKEPGLHFLWLKLGWKGFFVNWLGQCHIVDLRLDQEYLRSQPVNSEEGAPLGVGVWYEMFISDPLAFLFKNADPRGSLSANVSNSTIRCLSNLPLGKLLSDRHSMSQSVREEVSPTSHDWGYKLGSVYIRKVHFRDSEMIRQIESKVVNRLRQVTSAIKQDGTNQMSIITNSAERAAAVEFAKAAAVRPKIVGDALKKISEDPEVMQYTFEIMETRRLIQSNAPITLLPPGGASMSPLLAALDANKAH